MRGITWPEPAAIVASGAGGLLLASAHSAPRSSAPGIPRRRAALDGTRRGLKRDAVIELLIVMRRRRAYLAGWLCRRRRLIGYMRAVTRLHFLTLTADVIRGEHLVRHQVKAGARSAFLVGEGARAGQRASQRHGIAVCERQERGYNVVGERDNTEPGGLAIATRNTHLSRDELSAGLARALVRAALKARVFLREWFTGKIRLEPLPEGGLVAHWNENLSALLRLAGTDGSGGPISHSATILRLSLAA
jgi:hypothetical protein